MSQPVTRQVEHEVQVGAPADELYELVADVGNWPQIFPPTVHVEYREQTGTEERIQIWATANGEAKTWTSRRVLDPAARRVEFRQEISQPPVRQMGGAWVIEPISEHQSRVRLLHDYRAVDDDPDNLAWIDQAVDRNSTAELQAMKGNAERVVGRSELMLSFADTVRIAGSVEDVYDFIDRADQWDERLPHVTRVSLHEDPPGLQRLEMDTMTKDGSVHTTESVRVCLPSTKIVYKQVVLPALMTLHTGYWLFEQDEDWVAATSQHTVAINEASITQVLGEGADLAQARDFVRDALSGNSTATLTLAKDHVESRR